MLLCIKRNQCLPIQRQAYCKTSGTKPSPRLPVRKYFDVLLDDDIQRMPWNIRRSLDQFNMYCSTYFLYVASFLCRGVVVPDKALSFHAQAVSCFNKGKAAKGLQFGRGFQLGRIGGNVLLVASCTSIRM